MKAAVAAVVVLWLCGSAAAASLAELSAATGINGSLSAGAANGASVAHSALGSALRNLPPPVLGNDLPTRGSSTGTSTSSGSARGGTSGSAWVKAGSASHTATTTAWAKAGTGTTNGTGGWMKGGQTSQTSSGQSVWAHGGQSGKAPGH